MHPRAATSIALLLCVAGVSSQLEVSASPQEGESKIGVAAPARDPYQRSIEIHEFKITAKSGPQRGEELFYFKCSFCHNRFAKPELMRDVMYAPPLEGFADRQMSGGDGESARAVAETRLRAKIQSGGPAMPSYRYTLTDADVQDLVAYILGGSCCVDGENPPLNPRYVATAP